MVSKMGMRTKFRSLTLSAPRRRIEAYLTSQYPEAAAAIEIAEHPRLTIKAKPAARSCYEDRPHHFTLISHDDTPAEENAEIFYSALLHSLEQNDKATAEMSERRQSLYRKLFQDKQGQQTKFTWHDINSAAPADMNDRNHRILSQVKSFIETADNRACQELKNMLSNEGMILNIHARAQSTMSGRYSPDSRELTVIYDPQLSDLDAAAQIILTVLHESCHYHQHQNGLLADNARDADNYRELFHLNELQAHTNQYKLPLKLFIDSPDYKRLAAGSVSLEDLAEEWQSSADVKDHIFYKTFCVSALGKTILTNLQARQQAGLFSAAPETELIVKETLCQGKILSVDKDAVTYDTDRLSTMQRYAHSHIAVLNHSVSGGGFGHDKESMINDAVLGHFCGPLGLSKSGNTMTFATPELTFHSAATGREISVRSIESLWQKDGAKNTQGLGFKSEDILATATQETPNAKNSHRAPQKKHML